MLIDDEIDEFHKFCHEKLSDRELDRLRHLVAHYAACACMDSAVSDEAFVVCTECADKEKAEEKLQADLKKEIVNV